MDRRQFLQASGALALGCSPISATLSQTSWTPPYAVPASGQVISLSAGNTLNAVATAANGWGNYTWSFARATPIYNGYGFGAFAEDYSAGGAMVIAGVGGHHAGGIWGGFIFDFATGQWISKANTNGKIETPDDPARTTVDWNTGELGNKSGLTGQLPIPGHGYLWHFCPPKSIGGGTKGYLIKCCIAAGSDEGWDASRSFKFDLDTGQWSYASDNRIDFDGQYLNPYTDGGGAWDAATNRFYTPQRGAYSGQLRYLDRTATGWTWRRTDCPNLRNATLATAFVEGRDLVLGYMDGAWQKVNLDNTAAGAASIAMANANLASGYFYTRWHRYPADGCWYALKGTANRSTITTWPSDGSPPTTLAADQALLKIDPRTWTMSRVPIAGGIVALWESVYTATPPHGNAFVYVPALQCFAWFPRHDAPVQLIRPPSGTSAGDTQPPTVPTNVRVTGATTASIAWAWNASTDNGGGSVAGYRVALYDANDLQVGGVVDVGNALGYTASGLSVNTTYKLRVAAYDNATPTNVSAFSTAVPGATSSGGDTQPPASPGGLRVRSVQQTSIAWAWNASTDSGGGVVAGYRIALYDANDVPLGNLIDVGNVLSYTAEGLTPDTTYKLRVAAYDNAIPANQSALSAPVAGTTKKPPPGKR